jgi:hypothetical protein
MILTLRKRARGLKTRSISVPLAAAVAVATVLGLWIVWGGAASSSQSTSTQVFDSISVLDLEEEGITFVDLGANKNAAIGSDAGLRKLGGDRGRKLKEDPELVRLREPVPGAPSSEGLLWAYVLDEPAPSTERGAKPGDPPTYFVMFYSAETGDFVLAVGGPVKHPGPVKKPQLASGPPAGLRRRSSPLRDRGARHRVVLREVGLDVDDRRPVDRVQAEHP